MVRVSGMEFLRIPMAHNSVERDQRGSCRFLGYVASIGGLRLYHSGDSLLHDEFGFQSLRPLGIDNALVPD